MILYIALFGAISHHYGSFVAVICSVVVYCKSRKYRRHYSTVITLLITTSSHNSPRWLTMPLLYSTECRVLNRLSSLAHQGNNCGELSTSQKTNCTETDAGVCLVCCAIALQYSIFTCYTLLRSS